MRKNVQPSEAQRRSDHSATSIIAVIKRVLAHNFWLKVSACTLAVFLWLYVQNETTVKRNSSHSFKMTLPDPPSDFVVTSQKTFDITVKVSGPRDLTPSEIDKLSASVDLTRAKYGRQTVKVDFTPPPGLGSGWDWDLSRKYIRVVIDKVKVASKDITLETRGLSKPDLVYTGATLQPLKTEIRGAGARVDSVKQVRAVLDLSVAELGNSYIVKLEPLDANGKPIAEVICDPSEVAVRPALIPAPTEKNLVVTPTWTGQLTVGYRIVDAEITPNQVLVKGRSEVLARLVSIETEPLPLDDLKENTVLQTTLKVPPGVKLQSKPSIQVRVRIEPTSARSN